MAFQIKRRNEANDTTITAPTIYTTGEEAFRAAMDNVMTFIMNYWDTALPPGPNGPANDNRFKIYIERRPSMAEVELRYDYPDPPLNQQTNSIYWRIVVV